MFKTLMISAAVAAAAFTASAAAAQGAHLNDSQYVQAARCQALMTSQALGREDTTAIDALLRQEARGRTPDLLDRASEAGGDARRAAMHAGPTGRAELIAQRNSACGAWVGGAVTTASVPSAQPEHAN